MKRAPASWSNAPKTIRPIPCSVQAEKHMMQGSRVDTTVISAARGHSSMGTRARAFISAWRPG